jgi:hypothetical protein
MGSFELSNVFGEFENECSRFRPLNLWRACGGFCFARRHRPSPEEHFLGMEGVRGSIPLPPTMKSIG